MSYVFLIDTLRKYVVKKDIMRFEKALIKCMKINEIENFTKKELEEIVENVFSSPYGELPGEMIMEIALAADLDTISKMCRTSKKFNEIICDNDTFWKLKLQREFGGNVELSYSDATKWKVAYKTALENTFPLINIVKKFSDYSAHASQGFDPKKWKLEIIKNKLYMTSSFYHLKFPVFAYDPFTTQILYQVSFRRNKRVLGIARKVTGVSASEIKKYVGAENYGIFYNF